MLIARFFLDQQNVRNCNLFSYCVNDPISGTDFDGTFDWSDFWSGLRKVVTGVCAIAAGIAVIASGVALVPMIAVAAVTVTAGVLTAVNGAADIGEAATGYNFVKDGVFQGNETAYNIYSGITEGVAIVGTAVCGGWLKYNSPRIKAYKGIENYRYTRTAASHTDRIYNNSVLIQKQIIKYGKMAKDTGDYGYIFSVMGSVNGKENYLDLVLILQRN